MIASAFCRLSVSEATVGDGDAGGAVTAAAAIEGVLVTCGDAVVGATAAGPGAGGARTPIATNESRAAPSVRAVVFTLLAKPLNTRSKSDGRTKDLDGQVSDLFLSLQLPSEVIDETLIEARRILQETHGEIDEQRRKVQAHKAVLEARRDSLETKFADDEIQPRCL